MRPFAIAGIQMKVNDKGKNLDVVTRRIEGLVRNFPWIELVLLSELAPCGHRLDRAEPMPGPTEAIFRELAAKHGIWLVPGSIYERGADGIHNTTPVIAPDGHVVGRHRKLFPFEPYESGVTAGTEPLVFDIPDVGRFGISICYDMWFPETSRWLAVQGVEVILHPSLTDTIDRDIELAIVRATAAQNQCFVLDVNGLGDGGIGRSIFVGPAGDTLHMASTHSEDIPMEIDLDRVSRSREVGLRGLGQPLKSFRDRAFGFPFYGERARSAYLDSLGPLRKAERGTRTGIRRAPMEEGGGDE